MKVLTLTMLHDLMPHPPCLKNTLNSASLIHLANQPISKLQVDAFRCTKDNLLKLSEVSDWGERVIDVTFNMVVGVKRADQDFFSFFY